MLRAAFLRRAKGCIDGVPVNELVDEGLEHVEAGVGGGEQFRVLLSEGVVLEEQPQVEGLVVGEGSFGMGRV